MLVGDSSKIPLGRRAYISIEKVMQIVDLVYKKIELCLLLDCGFDIEIIPWQQVVVSGSSRQKNVYYFNIASEGGFGFSDERTLRGNLLYNNQYHETLDRLFTPTILEEGLSHG